MRTTTSRCHTRVSSQALIHSDGPGRLSPDTAKQPHILYQRWRAATISGIQERSHGRGRGESRVTGNFRWWRHLAALYDLTPVPQRLRDRQFRRKRAPADSAGPVNAANVARSYRFCRTVEAPIWRRPRRPNEMRECPARAQNPRPGGSRYGGSGSAGRNGGSLRRGPSRSGLTGRD